MAQTPVLFIFQLWARAGSWVANSVPVLPRAGAVFLWADPLRGVPASGRHGAHVCARPKGDSGRVLLPLAGTGPLGRPFCSRGFVYSILSQRARHAHRLENCTARRSTLGGAT